MIASPQPLDVVEIEHIRALLDRGVVVIAGGGGGRARRRVDGRLVGAWRP